MEVAAVMKDANHSKAMPATRSPIETTPGCDACGEESIGMGIAVVMAVPGMLFPSTEYDVPVFIPDPDVKFRSIVFPNGATGFVTDETTTKYLHRECYDDLVEELAYAGLEEIDDDDDE